MHNGDGRKTVRQHNSRAFGVLVVSLCATATTGDVLQSRNVFFSPCIVFICVMFVSLLLSHAAALTLRFRALGNTLKIHPKTNSRANVKLVLWCFCQQATQNGSSPALDPNVYVRCVREREYWASSVHRLQQSARCGYAAFQ